MRAIIALGSNLGDRHQNLSLGLKALGSLGSITPSPLIMETPDESGQGPAYLNTVARLETELDSPCRVLEELLRLELQLGRDRSRGCNGGRNAPRTLDLDLIEVMDMEGIWTWSAPEDLKCLGDELVLVLPHPRAAQRAFVQEPLKALINLA